MNATWDDGTEVVLADVKVGEQLLVQHSDRSSKAVVTKLATGWLWGWQDGDTSEHEEFSSEWVILAGWGRSWRDACNHIFVSRIEGAL